MAAARPATAGSPSSNAELRKRCNARLEALRSRRFTYLQRWIELSENIDPRRGSFYMTAASQQSRGRARDQKIKDSTARDALRVLQSGFMSGATSPARPWFKWTLDIAEIADNAEVKVWCAEVQKRMLHVIADSNAYPVLHDRYGDLGLFGTAGFIVLEDFDDVIRLYPLVIGEFFIGLDERLAVNTLYREFVLNVGQVVGKFGRDQCSDQVKNFWDEGKLDQEIDIVHAIEPNDERDLTVIDAKGMPIREVYYEKSSKVETFLAISGYHEFPAMIPRWDVNGNEAWGTGPGMDALPDAKQLSFEQVQKGQAIAKQVNPSMTAPASMRGQPMTGVPGGVTFVPPNTGADNTFKPAYQPNIDLSHLSEDIVQVQGRIKTAFYANLFMAISEMEGVQPRNDLEITERKDEKLVQLGPALERLHGEMLSPFLMRVYHIMERAGLIPEKPEAMGHANPKIEFVSVLAQAQKAVGTASIERYMQFIGSLYEVFPEARDKVDVYTMLDRYGDMVGVDPDLIPSNDDAQKSADARNQAQAKQQAAENLPAMVGAGKTLSETDVGGGISALQMATGQQ